MKDLLLIFEGSDTEVQILKHKLQDAEIPAFLKNESKSASIAGFGSLGSCRVFVNPTDAESAKAIVQNLNV